MIATAANNNNDDYDDDDDVVDVDQRFGDFISIFVFFLFWFVRRGIEVKWPN